MFLMPKLGSYRYVHHTHDALTSYPEGRATTSDSGKVIANFIFQDLLCYQGALEEIVMDNSQPYINALKILSKHYGTNHIWISGYNSRANGIVESKHFDVHKDIVKTCEGNLSRWHKVLPQVFWAERATIRKTTGYSPYYMVHGVHPLLPFDVLKATFLAPSQDFGISTKDLIATRAIQLAKHLEDISAMKDTVTEARMANLVHFKKNFGSCIIDFDFKPGSLVLVLNSCIEESLNCKTKPCHTSPFVVVRKTIGSYVIAELNGSQSQLRVAVFRVIPYVSCYSTSIPIIPNTSKDNNGTCEDPEDLLFFESIKLDDREYTVTRPPRLYVPSQLLIYHED